MATGKEQLLLILIVVVVVVVVELLLTYYTSQTFMITVLTKNQVNVCGDLTAMLANVIS